MHPRIARLLAEGVSYGYKDTRNPHIAVPVVALPLPEDTNCRILSGGTFIKASDAASIELICK